MAPRGPTRGQATQRRPSQVLRLPTQTPGWSAPPSPADPAPTRSRTSRGVRLGVAAATAVVLLVTAVTSAGGPGRASQDVTGRGDRTGIPDLVTDVATEDAVVAVLLLFTEEVALDRAAAPDAGVFALPGPLARTTAVRDQVSRTRSVLADLRQAEVAVGTPGRDYALDTDHDALLDVALALADLTADLAILGGLQDTLLTGAGTADLTSAPGDLADVVSRRPDGPVATWVGALQDVLAGAPRAAETAAQARAGADALWRQQADVLGPAGLEPLAAFLNGIDPGVLAALDGHPVAGPALRSLRG